MLIRSITLANFRNYEKLNISPCGGVNVFLGNNAQGKTNLLEAIYFCATGRSRRTPYDRNLIRFGEKEARVCVKVTDENGKSEDKIDVFLRKNGKKSIAVNGMAIKRLGELFGVLYVVSFSPEDLDIVKDGPLARRRFIDLELCQLSPVYYYDLKQYHRILLQRNNLLKEISKDSRGALMDSLSVWDEQLVAFGCAIMAKRAEFLTRLGGYASKIHADITGGAEELTVSYKPDVSPERFMDKLISNRKRDIYQGQTGAGIHKDDIGFEINSIDARLFGSQGQQRTAALSAKLSEIEMIVSEKHEKPVLLLDDVFSELDTSRQEFLLDAAADCQTMITATGAENGLNRITNEQHFNNEETHRTFFVKNGEIS